MADPIPIQIRWQIVPQSLGINDHWINITGGHGARLYSGTTDRLHSALRRLPSMRLVILGEPGAGKTTAAIQLLLGLIGDARTDDPVPVLLPMSSWRPSEHDLHTWLCAQLATDYPALGAGHQTGRTVAAALVDDGYILPILDGMDEIPTALHGSAIEAMNASLGANDPLVLTCRTDEYITAVESSDSLTSAGVIQLLPLGLADLVAYLPRTARPRGDSSTVWDSLLSTLRQRPDDEATRRVLSVLRTPLMTSLAREVYSDSAADPAELMSGFATAAELRAHLFDQTVPSAYRDPRGGGTAAARRWLTEMALLLDRAGTYDLAWWRLPTLGPRWVAAAGGGVMGAAATLALGVWSLRTAVLLAALVVVGTSVGAFLGLRQPPVPSTVRWSLAGGLGRLWRAARPSGPSVRRTWATGGMWWLVALAAVIAAVELRAGWVPALATAAAVGLARIMDAWVDVPADLTIAPDPRALLRADRNSGISRAVLRGGIVGGTAALLAGPLVGGSVAIAALIASVGFTAWGRFSLVRAWYALRARLPWRLWTFLEDALRRGVLRRMGAAYQFRHAHLQDRLAGRAIIDDAVGSDIETIDPHPPLWPSPADRPRVVPAGPGTREGGVVVVLTALELEHQAVRRHLVDLQPVVHPAGTVFEVGILPGCPRPVAVSALGEGNQTAAVVTDRSAALFQPELILFVGVAGGLHSDIALGDIVVATRVYSYQGGQAAEAGFLARPRAWDAPHHLEQQARYLSRTGAWRQWLTGSSADQPPLVHFRPIAAGEVLLTTPRSNAAQIIRQHYNDAAAVEMEGAGVARAAHLNRATPALIIRGISDRADSDKQALDHAGWQQVAAANVAAFALGLIASLPVDGL